MTRRPSDYLVPAVILLMWAAAFAAFAFGTDPRFAQLLTR